MQTDHVIRTPPLESADRQGIAIVGWMEGLAGQVHACLQAEGIRIDCFVSEDLVPPKVFRRPRAAKNFDYPTETHFKGLPLISGPDWQEVLVSRGISKLIIACADNRRRLEILNESRTRFQILSYIHPSATILPEAEIAAGAIVLARAVIGYRAEIQEGAVVNTGAQIDHNSVVRPGATVAPGAIICGSVEIAECATVFASATVLNSLTIGAGSIVGANSLVRHDVAPHTLVVGVPARFLRELS